MKKQDLDALKDTGEAVHVMGKHPRHDLLTHLAQAFDQVPNEQFMPVKGVEGGTVEELRDRTYGGTVLDRFADAIQTQGEEVDGTIGSIMDALEVHDRKVLHEMVCFCNHPRVSGKKMAEMIRWVRDTPELRD